MSDSTSNLDGLSPSSAGRDVLANSLFDAMSQNALYGRRASTTAALTWGYYGGKKTKADATIATIANGTIALTDAATNYLYATDAGVVTKVTSAPTGWPAPLAADAMALYEIVTSGGAVTSYTDYRTPLRGADGADGGAADIAADTHAATGKTTPVDADEIPLVDSAASFALKKLTWANLKATMWSSWGALIAAGTSKATPVDADTMAIADSAASSATKKLTWANLKATLKTYFDTLYATTAPSVTVVSYSATTTVDLSTIPNNGIARITLTGNITVQLSNGTDGQKFVLELIQDGTGSRLVTLSGTYFRFGTDITSFTATTTASKMDRVGCIYNTTATKADVVAVVKGY